MMTSSVYMVTVYVIKVKVINALITSPVPFVADENVFLEFLPHLLDFIISRIRCHGNEELRKFPLST